MPAFVASALASFFLTEIVKMLSRLSGRDLHPVEKAGFALVLATGAHFALRGTLKDAPQSVGIAGLAVLVHKTYRALSAFGDVERMRFLLESKPTSRR